MIWAWALKNWRMVLFGALAVGIVLGWAYVSHLQHIARARKAQLETATQQVRIEKATTRAVDQVATTIAKTEEKTHATVRRIEAAQGADAPVPDDVLAQWRIGLRDDAEPKR